MLLLTILQPIIGVVAMVSLIWLLVLAFKKNVWWGLGILFLAPIVGIVFAIKYWEEAKTPFLIYMGCVIVAIACVFYFFSFFGGFEMISMATRVSQGEEISDAEAKAFMESTIERMESSGLIDPEERAKLDEMKKALAEWEVDESGEPTEPITVPDEWLASRDTTQVASTLSAEDAAKAEAMRQALIERSLARFAEGPSGPADDRTVSFGQAGNYVGEPVAVTVRGGREVTGVLIEANSSRLVLEKYLVSGTVSFELRRSEVKALERLLR